MKTHGPLPETLVEAVRYFADPDVCLSFVAGIRWPNGVVCPRCGSPASSFLSTRRLWKCRDCKKQFSAKVGSILEDSPISLDKWLPAMWMIANDKNGISSYEVARALGVTQPTAWFMMHRIRIAMQTGSLDKKLSGEVEVDETFIGGSARFMHKAKRAAKIKGGTGMVGKTAVMGLLERHGEDGHSHSRVVTHVVGNTRAKTLHDKVTEHVAKGADVFTDALASYRNLDTDYIHKVIDHAEAYAKGRIHTNGLENFWSLLKRAIKGTYVSVEPFHLFRYLDEQSFRYNSRKLTDGLRFLKVVNAIFGKRLTHKELIGDGLPAFPATT